MTSFLIDRDIYNCSENLYSIFFYNNFSSIWNKNESKAIYKYLYVMYIFGYSQLTKCSYS